eukprot:COSAG02_NODE_607_length_19608_cov_33.568968_4_plen_149_part_00
MCIAELRDLCIEKGHLIELPDWSVRDKMWPVFEEGHQAFHVGPTILVTEFMVFADAWELILNEWDDGDFATLQPNLANPTPLLALLLAIGNVALAKKQAELEGSSASFGGTYKGAFSDGREGRSIESEKESPKATKGHKIQVAPTSSH